MAFQQTVNTAMGFGVPGDICLESPYRVEPVMVNSPSMPNTFGHAFTKDAHTNIAQVGGTIGANVVFAGLLVNSKEAVSYGTTSGTLEPSLDLPNNHIGQMCTMGDVVVQVATPCKVGDWILYSTSTGQLSTVAPDGTIGAGFARVPNAVVYRYPVTSQSGGLTVARLTN